MTNFFQLTYLNLDIFTKFKNSMIEEFGESYTAEIMQSITSVDFDTIHLNADKYATEQVAKLKERYKENYILSQVLEIMTEKSLKEQSKEGEK